jgi:heme oxygenase
MGKYGELSRNDGHSKWFLQRTLVAHDKTMDHPWMQMIYNQTFTVQQYCAWLAMNHASFKALEELPNSEVTEKVNKKHLLRTASLEVDLIRLRGEAQWKTEAAFVVSSSKATQRYLAHLAEDAEKPHLALAHHFLQYNAVLSGGAFLGEMVQEKFCVPFGAPGVAFYAFEGVKQGKGAAEVQRYLKDFDTIGIGEEDRQSMLAAMQRVYDDVEEMMSECYEMNPQSGIAYGSAKGADGKPAPPPRIADEDMLELSVSELRDYCGQPRIIMSLGGELLDVSAGRDMYGPGGGYSLLAGHDVTRCLATMSLEPEDLDDLDWQPTSPEDEQALANWQEKLKAKYPVAGKLRREGEAPATPALGAVGPPEGLRQRSTATTSTAEEAAASSAPAPAPAPAPAAAGAAGDEQRCPLSGKTGVGCPMAMFTGGGVAAQKAAAPKAKEAPKSGFMKGKSMIAAVEESKPQGESWIYKLCPLHWDANTTRLLIAVATAAWVSGIFVGWNLNRQWTRWMAT